MEECEEEQQWGPPWRKRHGIPSGSDCQSMRLAAGIRALPRPKQQFGATENTHSACSKKQPGGDKACTQKEEKRSSWGSRNGAAEAAMTWSLSLLKQSKSRCWLTGKLSRAIGPHLNGDRLSGITHSPASLKTPSRGGHSLQKSTKELDPSPTCVPKSRLLSLLERHLSKAPIEKTWATASVKAVYWDVQNTWGTTTSEGLYWVSDLYSVWTVGDIKVCGKESDSKR